MADAFSEPLTIKQSMDLMKKLIKTNKTNFTLKHFKPGSILSIGYNAKDKTQKKILKRGRTHTLAINFHWAPIPLRIILVKEILKLNYQNIKKKLPLEFDYQLLKPFLKKIGFAPIIRLYINNRISRSGVVIPDEHILNAAKLKTETFVKGKVDADTLYRIALRKNKQYRATRKRRE